MLAKLSYSVTKAFVERLELLVLYVLEKSPIAWFLAMEIVLPA